MVKKYLIFDRFDFLCRFFSRFFNNDFFWVVRNLRVLHRISPYVVFGPFNPTLLIALAQLPEIAGSNEVEMVLRR